MPYVRTTRDEYLIEQDYGYGYEEVCAEDSFKAARARSAEYRYNVPGFPVRIRKVRVPLSHSED